MRALLLLLLRLLSLQPLLVLLTLVLPERLWPRGPLRPAWPCARLVVLLLLLVLRLARTMLLLVLRAGGERLKGQTSVHLRSPLLLPVRVLLSAARVLLSALQLGPHCRDLLCGAMVVRG